MTMIGFGQTNFSPRKLLMDYDGNIKIGRRIGIGALHCRRLILSLACAEYSEQWQNHPTMLVPLVHQLMYPWDYDDKIAFHPEKWSKDSEAIEFWQALLQPNTTMDDLLAVRPTSSNLLPGN